MYDVDEIGLNYKMFLKSMIAAKNETVLRTNLSKERLTVKLCYNASRNHKIPLIVLGKLKKSEGI